MKKVSIIILSILLCLVVFDFGHMFLANQIQPKEYRPIEIKYDYIDTTKEELKEKINKLYHTQYFYTEKDLSHSDCDGRCAITIRLIIVNENLYSMYYAYVLAHELTHLKHRTLDETFVSFTAFKTLYESGDEDLKNCALYYANMVMCGCYDGKYDCGWYIINYLEEFSYEM